MKKIYRFFTGYLCVQLSGLSPERFLNLCSAAGVELWNVTFKEGTYTFHMGIKDYMSCRPFVRKAKVRLKIRKKFGLPFFLHKNRHRKCWAAGFFGFFVCMYLMSLFVWDIDYEGNLTYTDDMLNHYLETMNIRCGMMKSKIACEDLEASLRNQFNGITWVSARLSGTRLYIHVKENEVPLEIPQKNTEPCDLRASYDGVITSIVVRSGIAQVRQGDEVEKGQVLVSGKIPITDDGGGVVAEHYIHADADIVGRVKRTEGKEIPIWHKREEKTGSVRKGMFLNVFDCSFVWLFPNLRNTEWKTILDEKKLCLLEDFFLPVRYGKITSYEVVPYEKKYTEKELQCLAEEYKNEISENLIQKGVQIIENNVRILVNGSKCRFEADLITEESIKQEAAPEEGTGQEADMSEKQGE